MRSFRYVQALLVALGLFASSALAAPLKGDAPEGADKFPPAKSPAESLAAITVRPGLQVELVAAEPLVADPVDVAFGPDGRVWVVEMADYPAGLDGQGKPGGRIRYLEDTDGDGRLDRSTLFLENLRFPGSVAPWRNGVLITAAPDILYAEDGDGDGKAEKVEVLYSGFVEGNQQHRVNGLQWGLDNWIYVANGDSGGVIVSKRTGERVDISGRDLRIRPDTGDLDAQSGKTQYGRNRDDWGHWFGCNNSKPAWHFVLADHYLRRNPHFAPPHPWREISATPGAALIFPTSRTLARFNDVDRANRFTSACGLMIYRDERLGPDFVGNSFVCEPVHNLVHREVVAPDGVSFRSRRADDEQHSEFFASADSWSRPTSIRLAPDGSLWVVDMYRLVIEHPKWIPAEWQAKLDLRAGADKGRIYRIFNAQTDGRRPQLDQLSTADLVAALDSPNGWQRDMVQQLLLWRNDPAALAPLEAVARTCSRPAARLQALCTLEGLDRLPADLAAASLNDAHPGVRREAVRLCEPFLATDSSVGEKLLARLSDDDPQVQLQLACTLGAWRDPRAGEALASLALRHADEPYLLAAVWSSASAANVESLWRTLAASDAPAALRAEAAKFAVACGPPALVREVIGQVTQPHDERYEPWQFETLAGMTAALADAAPHLDAATRRQIAALFAQARADAEDEDLAEARRCAAIALLGREPEGEEFENDLELLVELLQPLHPPAIQEAALRTLAELDGDETPEMLLEELRAATPRLRVQIIEVLMSRAAWTQTLLTAAKEGRIPLALFDAGRRQQLTSHRVEAIRKQAAALFADTISASRREVVDQYRAALSLSGDVDRGRDVFRKQCSACHRLENVGHEVGADLAGLKNKTGEAMLIAILDPNEAVEDRYLDFAVITMAGRIFHGVLANESGASITLLGQEAKPQTILRSDIDLLQSTGKSLMPEGFEKQLTPQDVADLIAYMSGNQTQPAKKPAPPDPTADVAPGAATPLVEGNRPAPVRPDGDGKIDLPAHLAQPYGPKIKYMPEWKAFGWWTDQAHVAWRLEGVAPGAYEVEMEWSVGDKSAGNPFVIEAGGEKLAGVIAKSGSWETFQRAKLGTLQLTQPQLTLAVKPAGKFENALMDLRRIILTPVRP